MEAKKLLEVTNLNVSFWKEDRLLNAVKDVSFHINHGEIVAIVGESGSGKSVTAEALLGLHDSKATEVSGGIQLEGESVLSDTHSSLPKLRGKEIGIIFQDSMNSLDPVFKIENQFIETLKKHFKMNKKTAKKVAAESLKLAGVPDSDRVLNSYPHELSGGLQQRVMIALTISCRPKLLIGDEPTTALDVTIQYQILSLLKSIQSELNTGILLVTHDFGVVAEIATRVIVMYAGEIVESGKTSEIINNPLHPYTQSLLKSRIPKNQKRDELLYTIKGKVPSLTEMPESGCRFAPRIPWAKSNSHETHPKLHEVSDGHLVRCTCWKAFNFQPEVAI